MGDMQTIIGAGTTVRGTVAGNENLTIQGRLEGALSLEGKLSITAGGSVEADVTVQAAWIQGLLLGNIDATGKVHIASGGRVVGDIRAAQVVIEEGAAFNGAVDMGEFDVSVDAPQPQIASSAPSRTPSMPPQRPSVSRPAPVPTPVSVMPAREPEPPRAVSRDTGSFSRPPMPVPSRPAPVSVPVQPERRAAPAPRVRPVGHVKVKKPSF